MKTFEEVLADVAEEALHHELQTIFGLGLFRLSPSDDNIKKWNDEIAAYNGIREEIEHGGKLVYVDKPVWTIFDYSRFKCDKDKDFDPGHDNFDTSTFLETYGFEDHYFYLAWIKGYKTPMKIKMHIDPSSYIEVVSVTPYRVDPEQVSLVFESRRRVRCRNMYTLKHKSAVMIKQLT